MTSTSRGSPGHARSSLEGNLCHGARSETTPQLGTIWPEVKWSRFRSWQPASVLAGAQPERPIWVTTHRFRSSPPPHTTGSRKGRIAGRWRRRVIVVPAHCSWCVVPAHCSWCVVPAHCSWCVVPARRSRCVVPESSSFLVCRSRVVVVPGLFGCCFCPSFLASFLSARSVWLGVDKLHIHLLAPPFFTNLPADSASLSTHWLLAPSKSLPARPTVMSHSLDQR